MGDTQYNVIDLFAGCGGLSLGLYQAGWNGLFAIEKNQNAFETLSFNLIERKKHFVWPLWLPISPLNIIDVNEKYSNQLVALRGKVDLVAGGPPCQGFSMAGKRVEDDIRNKLVFSYIDFIEKVRPKLLFFENVKGFTYAFKKKDDSESVPYSEILKEKLSELGYGVYARVIDFSHYGVPQKRKRFIMVGVLGGNESDADFFFKRIDSRKQTFLKEMNLDSFCCVRDAISDLLRENGEMDTPDRKGFQSGMYGKVNSKYERYLRSGIDKKLLVPNSHSFAHHTSEKVACFQNLLLNYPRKGKRIDGKEREKWGIRQRGITVLDPEQLAPTITNMPDDYLHYSEPRIMTVRECARIQSFPDWYEFKSKYTTGGQMRKKEVPRYSQVGNAIPPLFALQAGMVLKEMI